MSVIDWELVRSSLGPLLEGLLYGTLPLTATSFVLGLALALVLALMRLSGRRVVAAVARAYVSVIRGTPLLLQLFIIFYGQPSVGITIDPFPSAVIAFTLDVGGYASEAVRASILAVPRGQWEASMTVGMGWATTPAAHRAAAGVAHRRAAAQQHAHRAGEGHVPGLDDPGHGAAAQGAGDRGAVVRVLHPLRRHRGLLLGRVPGAVVRTVGLETRLSRYVAA